MFWKTDLLLALIHLLLVRIKFHKPCKTNNKELKFFDVAIMYVFFILLLTLFLWC